jgi:cobalt-zinc-cadmium efflux system protein
MNQVRTDHAHKTADEHGHARHEPGPHAHTHAPKDFGARFIIGIGLNIFIVVLEAVFGVFGNSVALIADAAHNLSDALGLGIAFAAHIIGKRPPSPNFSYGLRGSSILAALFNAVFLLVITGGLSWEAVQRVFSPAPVNGTLMMIVAAIGMTVNAATAALFASGRKGDINIRGAFLHMAADAMISAGVAAAGLLIVLTGWQWIDPIISLIINAIIIGGTWSLLRESLSMSLNGVPKGIIAADVARFLTSLPGVNGLHDLHIWPISTTETALTAHIVMSHGHPGDAFLIDVSHKLHDIYGIGHATLQVELDQTSPCVLAPNEVI